MYVGEHWQVAFRIFFKVLGEYGLNNFGRGGVNVSLNVTLHFLHDFSVQ
jgi:hypothetical protein